MPLCLCGLKVDRSQLSVQCFICKQFFHAKCCNINVHDIKFIKNKYKCVNCIKDRRLSCSSLPNISPAKDVVADDHAQTVVAVDIAEPEVVANYDCNNTGLSTFAENNTGLKKVVVESFTETSCIAASPKSVFVISNDNLPANDFGAENVDITNNNSNSSRNDYGAVVDIDGALIDHNESVNCDGFSNNKLLSDNVILNTILSELRTLKLSNISLSNKVHSLASSNESLNAMVCSLRNENKLLISKLSNIEVSIEAINGKLDASTKSLNSPKSNRNLSLSLTGTPITGAVQKLKSTNIQPTSALSSSPMNSKSFADIARPLSENNTKFAHTSSAVIDLTSDLRDGKRKKQTTSQTITNIDADDKADSNWVRVNSRNNNNNALIGTRVGNELNALPMKKWLHLSSFKNTVEEKSIVEFLTKNTGIAEEHFTCFKLVKKGVSLDDLKFINFKLGVSICHYDKLFDSNLWPENIKVRPFNFLEARQKLTSEMKQPQPIQEVNLQ